MEHNSDSSHSGPDYADIGCRVREARVELDAGGAGKRCRCRSQAYQPD